MKNKILPIITVILIVGGAVLSYFAKVPLLEFTGLGATMFGAGLAFAQLYNAQKKEGSKNGFLIASMVLISVGCFIAGLTGCIDLDTTKNIISYTVALVAIIASVITGAIGVKKAKEIE